MEEAESDVEKEVPNRGDATNQRKPWWYHGWVPSLHGWYVFFFAKTCDYGISWCKGHIEFYMIFVDIFALFLLVLNAGNFRE